MVFHQEYFLLLQLLDEGTGNEEEEEDELPRNQEEREDGDGGDEEEDREEPPPATKKERDDGPHEEKTEVADLVHLLYPPHLSGTHQGGLLHLLRRLLQLLVQDLLSEIPGNDDHPFSRLLLLPLLLDWWHCYSSSGSQLQKG